MKRCFRSRQFELGLEILSEMKSEGHMYDGFAYCTAISALVKMGKIKEANDCMEQMIGNGIVLDLVSYNTLINLYCKEGKLEAAFKLLDEIEKGGLECDRYTHTIIIDGLCKAGNIEGAQQHLSYMNTMGFDSNLVALNCMIDGLCKAGQIDCAMKLFESMEIKDSFTYTSLVHNLCRARRFRSASKLLLSCLKNGMKILKSTQRAVLDGLRNSGYTSEARKLKSKIWSIRLLH